MRQQAGHGGASFDHVAFSRGASPCACGAGTIVAETHAVAVHGHHAVRDEDVQVHGVQDADDGGGEDAVPLLPAAGG